MSDDEQLLCILCNPHTFRFRTTLVVLAGHHSSTEARNSLVPAFCHEVSSYQESELIELRPLLQPNPRRLEAKDRDYRIRTAWTRGVNTEG